MPKYGQITITTRQAKGSPLTIAELDENFVKLADAVGNMTIADEIIDDRVAALFQSNSSITFVYDDDLNTFTANALSLDGLDTSISELNFVKNVTSAIQTQLDDKAPTHTHPYLANDHDASAVTSAGITNWDAAHSHSILVANNPHSVLASDIGLGSVDNTADINKNVLSATKLTTTRTIELEGDITGSVNFDGSSNVAVDTTVGTLEELVNTQTDLDTTTFDNQWSTRSGSGDKVLFGTAGANANSAGKLVYLNDAKAWTLADATTSVGISSLLGITLGTDPSTNGILLNGLFRVNNSEINGTIQIGAPVYISNILAGYFSFTLPSISGHFARIVGYCVDTEVTNNDILLYFNPSATWIEIS